MASKPKYKDAKTEYVRTPAPGIGLRKIAKQWNIPFGTLGTQSAKDNWPALRKAYQSRVDEQAQTQAINHNADAKAEIISKSEHSLLLAAGLVNACMRRIYDESAGDFIPGVNTNKITDLLLTAKRAIDAVGNIKTKHNELYNIDTDGSGSGSDTPEVIAAAIRTLALSQGTIPSIPRSEIN